MRRVIHKNFKCTLFGFRFWYLALDSGWDGRVSRHWMWFQGCGGCRAVVEMVPGGVPFHLGNCWCCSGDFDCSFSPGLVSLSPEHPGPWSPGSTPLGRSSSGSGILLLLLSTKLDANGLSSSLPFSLSCLALRSCLSFFFFHYTYMSQSLLYIC